MKETFKNGQTRYLTGQSNYFHLPVLKTDPSNTVRKYHTAQTVFFLNHYNIFFYKNTFSGYFISSDNNLSVGLIDTQPRDFLTISTKFRFRSFLL